MRRLTAVLFASLALVACGDDDGGEGDLTADDVQDMQEAIDNAPLCSEIYAEGNVLEEGQHQEPCTKDDGEVTFLGTGSEDCADGRRLLWNDAAWWFEGEGVHPHPAGSDANVPPETAYNSCGG